MENNYDDQTLAHAAQVMDDLLDLDRRKIRIHLERVWQTGNKMTRDNIILKDLISQLQHKGFDVSYMNLSRRSHSCKSSKKRQIVISYDGKVYKCLGRDFTESLSEGQLNNDGSVSWNHEKLDRRLRINTHKIEMCKNCTFLPQCWGPCCQKQLEANDGKLSNYCQLNLMEMSLGDFIKYKFNKAYIIRQHEMVQ